MTTEEKQRPTGTENTLHSGWRDIVTGEPMCPDCLTVGQHECVVRRRANRQQAAPPQRKEK